MEKYCIHQTEEIFDAGLALINAYKISKADDGKVTIPGDLLNFIGPLTKVPVAIEGADQVPKELGDLSKAEILQLKARFGEIVNDERYQRVFFGLATAGDAIKEIVSGEKLKSN